MTAWFRYALLWATALGIGSQALDARGACAPVLGRFVSLQGTVEVLRAGEDQWDQTRRLDTPICAGDKVRTLRFSRAAFMVNAHSIVRVDQNTTLSVALAEDEIVLEVLWEDTIPPQIRGTTPAPAGGADGVTTETGTGGAVYVITRSKQKFGVRTPFYSAAHEGTEFLVSARAVRGELYVFEGAVVLEDRVNAGVRMHLRGGEAVTVAPGEPRAVRRLVTPPDSVQWTLYYPAVADAAAPDDVILSRDCSALDASERSACLVARAEALLRLGQAEQARSDIALALAIEPGNGDAKALSAIIAIVRNEKEQADALAREATQAAPDALRPWLALSYAQQARFDLDAALESARRGAELAQESALARARVAELLLSLGRIPDAEREAARAVSLNPGQSRSHLILGFAHLAQFNTRAARTSFLKAIELDQAEPLARLGLGLAIIRDGDLSTGREQIEIAVALDPTNSLLRSYLGKAYHEDNTKERDEFAATQFRLAKELDPKDPTPWFYSAIALQTLNRPGDALQEVQGSIARNDNRAVYRSRFLLDQDLGARSASLAQIYSDLGFDQLAVTEARRALTGDPAGFGAHRFLADSYVQLPGFETARISEILQSQLLQPVNAAPLSPQLQQFRSPILPGSGPITPSFQEFNPLFAQDRHALSVSGVAGSAETRSDEILYGYYQGGRSVQLGQYHYETDGFKTGANLREDSYRAFYQEELGPRTSMQAELSQNEIRNGDVKSQFDPTFDPSRRERSERTVFRLGGRHSMTPDSNLLGSLIIGREEHQTFLTTRRSNIEFSDEAETYAGELQYLARGRFGDIVAGGGLFQSEGTSSQVTRSIANPGSVQSFPEDVRTRSGNLYVYGYFGRLADLRLILGVSLDAFNNDDSNATLRRPNETLVSPKLGLVVPLGAGTIARLAAFRGANFIPASAQLPMLGPTQVAGFNQVFFDLAQTRFWRFGGAIDQNWLDRVLAGLELTWRNLDVPWKSLGLPDAGDADRSERTHRVHASWLVTKQLAATSEFVVERLEQTRNRFFTQTDIDTQSLPLGLTYHHPSGWFGGGRLSFVRQRLVSGDNAGAEETSTEHFKVLDLSLGFRLPRRWGIVSLDARNVLDEKFRFSDSVFQGPARIPVYVPERTVFIRLQLSL